MPDVGGVYQETQRQTGLAVGSDWARPKDRGRGGAVPPRGGDGIGATHVEDAAVRDENRHVDFVTVNACKRFTGCQACDDPVAGSIDHDAVFQGKQVDTDDAQIDDHGVHSDHAILCVKGHNAVAGMIVVGRRSVSGRRYGVGATRDAAPTALLCGRWIRGGIEIDRTRGSCGAVFHVCGVVSVDFIGEASGISGGGDDVIHVNVDRARRQIGWVLRGHLKRGAAVAGIRVAHNPVGKGWIVFLERPIDLESGRLLDTNPRGATDGGAIPLETGG